MKAMEFAGLGRVFTCEPGSSPATPETLWWWVRISGEAERHAAFRVEPGDTPTTVGPRVFAFYERLLADRARPRITRPAWGQRKPVSGTPEATETKG